MPGSLQPSGDNHQVISSTITTTIPKFIFLLFLGVFFYNDDNLSLFNDCLTPSISTKSWISKSLMGLFRLDRNSNGCEGFLKVFTSHRCMNELFIVDNAKVHRAISEMTAFQRFRYLLIVMTCKSLVPYLLQFSMLMLLLIVVVFICYYVLKLLESCGFDTYQRIQRIMEQVLPQEIPFVIGINHFGIALGLLIASCLACFVSSHGSGESAVCENTSCLYCITGLANTVFREIKTGNAIMLDPKFVVMYPAAKLICLGILTALVWIFTILFTCCVVYLATSVFYNIRAIGSVMMENLQGTSPDAIQSAWNKYMPPLPESVLRLFKENEANQGN